MHIPVLLNEILQGFQPIQLTYFFDGTLGLAGHAEALLEAHPEIEKYIGCDKDQAALAMAEKRLKKWQKKVKLYQGSFIQMQTILKKEKVASVQGILFDFGVCSLQLDDPKRGFSFREEGPLDMRMDVSAKMLAEEVINEFPEKKLGEVLKNLGEERHWKKIARAIVQAREKERIRTTKQLKDIVESVYWKRSRKHLHPATLTFQAIRIFVNQELEEIRKALQISLPLLEEGGRIAAISFHSGEDRMVKNIFREKAKEKQIQLLGKKPLVPSLTEIRKNPRARSAKLRWAERLGFP